MIEDLLRDTLASPSWDLPVRPDALSELRRRRAVRRRRTAAAAALGGLAVVGAVVGGLSVLPQHHAELATYAAGGVPPGSPAPGISPAWAPQSGRDWLLTDQAWQDFVHSHTRPSPAPGQSTVESPAPLGPQSEELLADVQAADLPPGTNTRREDAVGGQPGAAAVYLTLPDGTPVVVERHLAQEPVPYEGFADGPGTGITVVDVPGTASAAALYSHYSYGFGPTEGYPQGYPEGSAHGVQVMSRGGVATMWTAPSAVPLDTLKAWAFAAAQHAGD